MIVSAHGAAILLREPIITGQKLKLKNLTTKEEIECIVVDVNIRAHRYSGSGRRVCRALPLFLARLFSASRLESAKSGSQAAGLVNWPAETGGDKENEAHAVRNLRRAFGVAPVPVPASKAGVKAQKTLLSF
jgi:hypothetical protein